MQILMRCFPGLRCAPPWALLYRAVSAGFRLTEGSLNSILSQTSKEPKKRQCDITTISSAFPMWQSHPASQR